MKSNNHSENSPKSPISRLFSFIKTSFSSSPKKHSLPTHSHSLATTNTGTNTNNNRNTCTDLERVFRYIDENGDGVISPSELQTSVMILGGHRLSTEEAEAAVVSTDSDGDGFLGFEDFQKLMEAKDVSEQEKMAELKDAFTMFAVETPNDDDGVITGKSLKKMLSKLGEKKTVGECVEMIKVFDLNGDGVLCFDEFVVMMS